MQTSGNTTSSNGSSSILRSSDSSVGMSRRSVGSSLHRVDRVTVSHHSRFDEDAGFDSPHDDDRDDDYHGDDTDAVWLHGLGAPADLEEDEEEGQHGTGSGSGSGLPLAFHSHPVSSPSASATINAIQSLAALASNNKHSKRSQRLANRRARSARDASSSRSRSDSDSDTDEKEKQEAKHDRDRASARRSGTSDSDDEEKADGSDKEDDEDELAHLKPLPRSTQLLVRAGMCGLSLVLLWVTSLSLAEYVASSVAGSPAFEPVVNAWVATFSVANSQADGHARCGTSLLAGCNQALNASIVQREAEWHASQQAAQNETLRIQARSAQCEQASITTLQSINVWMSAGARMAYRDDSCSAAEVESLRVLLNDRRVNQQELRGLASSFVSTTDHVIQDTLAQLRLVQEYNAHYLSNQSASYRDGMARMQSQLGEMVDARALTSYVDAQIAAINATSTRMSDCLGRKGGANSLCPGGTLVDAYSAELARLRASYGSLQSLGQANLRALVLYSASVTRKLSDVQSFFNLLYPVANVLSSININIFDIPSLDDIPNVMPNQAFIDALANSVDLPDMGAYFSARAAPIQAKWSAEVDRAKQQALASVERALDNVSLVISGSFPPNPLRDYHPPQVEPQVESLQLQLAASAEVFQRGSDASVEALISLPGVVKTGWETLLNDSQSALPSNLTSLSFSLPPLSTLSLHMPIEGLSGSFSLSDTLIALLAAVGGVVLTGDYVYRNMATMRMVKQYVRAPQEILPVIDARTQASKEQQAAAQANSSSWTDKIAYYLTHSGTLMLVGAVFAAWVAALIVAAYIPLYESYRAGCVESREGTFISQNAYSLAYNYASVKGNMLIMVQLTEFEARRAMACGRYEQRFLTQQAQGGASAAVALNTQRAAWANMRLMAKCIDHTRSFNLSALPLNFSRPALPDPAVALAPQALDLCAVDVGSASSEWNSGGSRALFNCSWLPTCASGSACPGPSQATIRAATFDASCSTEYAAHQSLLYFALVSLIFLCLNASRSACMKAIVRLGWRALTPAGITFIATCDHRGRLISTAEEEAAAERKKRRRKRLEKSVNSSDADSSDLDSSFSSDSSRSDSSVSSSRRSSSSSAGGSSLRKHKQRSGKKAGSDASNIPPSLLHREMLAYESSAGRYLLLALLAHVPYLLLLFALRDPFGWGSSLRIAAPLPYHSEAR